MPFQQAKPTQVRSHIHCAIHSPYQHGPPISKTQQPLFPLLDAKQPSNLHHSLAFWSDRGHQGAMNIAQFSWYGPQQSLTRPAAAQPFGQAEPQRQSAPAFARGLPQPLGLATAKRMRCGLLLAAMYCTNQWESKWTTLLSDLFRNHGRRLCQ